MTTCGPQPLSWGSVLDRQAWRGHPLASVAEARLWVTGRSLTRDLDLTGILVAARRVLLLLMTGCCLSYVCTNTTCPQSCPLAGPCVLCFRVRDFLQKDRKFSFTDTPGTICGSTQKEGLTVIRHSSINSNNGVNILLTEVGSDS